MVEGKFAGKDPSTALRAVMISFRLRGSLKLIIPRK